MLLWCGGGLILNFAWELLQRPFFDGYVGGKTNLLGCFVASLGDVGLLAALYVVLWLATGDWDWASHMTLARCLLLASAGFIAATLVEWHGLSNARWSYRLAMPLISGLDVGLVPVLQMVLVPGALVLINLGLVRFGQEPRR